MAKVVDITDKLSFDENPRLKIKDVEVTVNADAETMLRIMGAFGSKSDLNAALDAYGMLFSAEDQKRIMGLKITAKDLMSLIRAAMNLVMGEDDQGEA